MAGLAFCQADAIAATNNKGDVLIGALSCDAKSGNKGWLFELFSEGVELELLLGLDVLVRCFFSPVTFEDIEQFEGSNCVYGPKSFELKL
jgi:hypothetical protein